MEDVQQPPNLKTLKNGAVYDLDIGRIVSGKGITTKITKENSIAYHSRRLERKRERIEAGARAAVDAAMPDAFTGEADDWIEAVAQAVTEKALDSDNPKQVDAARFLLTETGLAERTAEAQRGGEGGGVSPVAAVALLIRIEQARGQVVEVEAMDTDGRDAGTVADDETDGGGGGG